MRTLTLLVLLLTATSLYAQQVYRSYDAQGNVIYSDRPEGEGAEMVSLLATRPTTGAATTSPAASEPPPLEQAESLGAEIAREPTAEELRALRDHNCTVARERHENYTLSHRLFRSLPDGEREYLSDDEIDQARALAAADVELWCN